jgi:hypothetical protein
VELAVPTAVEQELRRQMTEKLVEVRQGIESAAHKFNKLLDGVGFETEFYTTQLEEFDCDEVMRKYDETCEVARAKWAIRLVRLTSRTTSDFLDLAIDRHPPFREVGRGKQVAGFQDAVILWSIAEDLERTPGCSGALLTLDGDFAAVRISRLTIYKSVEETIDALERGIDEQLRKELHDDEEVANAALTKYREAAESFVISSAPSGLEELVDTFGQGNSQLKSFEMEDIDYTIVERKEETEKRLRASFTIKGRLCGTSVFKHLRMNPEVTVWLELDADISTDESAPIFTRVRLSPIQKDVDAAHRKKKAEPPGPAS